MIGLIPAAGHAERLHGLPKFLLPIGDSYLLDILVRRMQAAGISRILVGANSENFDLVCRYAPDCTVYCVDSQTMSETVLAAREYFDVDEDVYFGMPDTYWPMDGDFRALGNHLFGAQIAVGLWYTDPVDRPKRGMCEIDGWQVRQVVDKPAATELSEGWGILAWKPDFWRFIAPDMPHVGYALQGAIDAGLQVDAVRLGGKFWDCGTLDEYHDCLHALRDERIRA